MPAIDHSGMRRVNSGATLLVIARADGAVTSAELVERTGLSRRTIELIVLDLIADGWVREAAPAQPASRAGRPKKFFELVPDRLLVLSVVIDGSRLSAALGDLRGTVLGRGSAQLDEEVAPRTVLAAAVEVAEAAFEEAGQPNERHLRVVAVAVAGTVDDVGIVLTSPESADWVGVDVTEPFRERFGCRVLAENSTNLAALAEQWSGAARQVDSFVLLMPGNRVAAGVVIDGEVYRGFQGAAGELIRIDELALSRWSQHPVAMITSPDPEQRAKARAIIERSAQGDEEASDLVAEFFSSVARLLGVLGWILAPPTVVLGGELQGLEHPVLAALSSALAKVDAPNFEVRIAQHGNEAALIGGLRLALTSTDDLLGSRVTEA